VSAESAAALARVRLRPGREKPIVAGHPWLFSGAIAREQVPAEGAALALVERSDGRPLGVGFYSAGSQLRVRMLTRDGSAIDRAFFAARLADAARLRHDLVPPDTDGYRLVNAEGDLLPGWTVDRFGDVLVSHVTVAGLERLREEAYRALADLVPGTTIVHLGESPARRAEGLAGEDVIVAGRLPESVEILEHGLRFRAEIGGQKTGFYCDQRENRRRIERLAGGRTLLDLFAHSGAFSVYALRGGAVAATAVESAPRLLENARRAIVDNGLDAARFEPVAADVFADLRERTARYGVVVCDPPPLARRKAHVDAAARAYKDVNRLALQRVEPGGYVATFSCSGSVDSKLFRQILFAAADEAGLAVQLLEPLAAGPDHPVSIYHPEGEYLKGWLARVAGPRS
jgi:23S rRNA (cytosine1962-C5)-methyltransferase